MGRKAGVSAEQTRGELLGAAARVFALKGYDGASIADITTEAGLSSGAIYAHYGSKAELFVAVVREHARGEFTDLLGVDPGTERAEAVQQVPDIAEFLSLVGSSLDRRWPQGSALMMEAMVAAKRHPEVAELVSSWLLEGESDLARALRHAQAGGSVDGDVGPEAFGRFVTMVALGSRMASALGLPEVDHDDWASLIRRLVDSARS